VYKKIFFKTMKPRVKISGLYIVIGAITKRKGINPLSGDVDGNGNRNGSRSGRTIHNPRWHLAGF